MVRSVFPMGVLARSASTPQPARSAALDGLRGFALIGMLGWHAQLTWLRGGFARMTVFFVLAGFLAMRSYDRRRDSGTKHPFLAFWSRRARRLLPVTILGAMWAVLVTVLVGSDHARATMRGDAFAVLLSASNWRFIVDERPYAALFDAPSAFQHYWSLSLEEQSFLLLPILVGIATLGHRVTRTRVVVTAVAASSAAFVMLPFLVSMSPDVVYYGTHVRLGEFLAGVALAIGMRGLHPDRITNRSRRVTGAAGAVSLAVLAVTMLTVDREQEWLYRGGMGLYAIPTVAVIAAAVVGSPVVERVLGFGPLRLLGRWAFSIYVVHWPLYQLLDALLSAFVPRTLLVVVEIAAAVALGGIVHHAIERPLMEAGRARPASGRVLRAWSRDRVAFACIAGAGVGALTIASAVPLPSPRLDFAAAQEMAEQRAISDLDVARRILREAEVGGLPYVRDASKVGIASFGGSTALMLDLGKWGWADAHPSVQAVPGHAFLGCGLLTSGERGIREAANDVATELSPARPPADRCLGWRDLWAATVVAHRVDVAVVVASQWDLRDWLLDGDHRWRHVGDPVLDAVLRGAMEDAADVLHGAGARSVVFLTSAIPELPDGHERAASYQALLERVAASRDFVQIVDLGEWVAGLPAGTRRELLPDGVHPSAASAVDIWTGYLGPSLEELVESVARERRAE